MKRTLVTKTTRADFPSRFLKTLNGNIKLTEKEIELTAAIVEKYLYYGAEGLREPFLSKFVFSTEERKKLCDNLDGLSSQNLGNKLKQLLGKRVLKMVDGGYALDAKLLPVDEITFKFIIIEDDGARENVQESSHGDGPEQVSSD